MKEIKQEWFNRPQTIYETPDEIFNPLRDEFGIDLDVRASRLIGLLGLKTTH